MSAGVFSALVVVLGLLGQNGFEVKPEVQAKVDPPEAKLGAPFTYDIVLVHPADQRFEWLAGEAASAKTGPIELLDHTRSPLPPTRDGQAQTHFQFRMAVFELGSQSLPALTFEVTQGGKTAQWTLPGAQVKGLATLPDDAQKSGAELLDLKPPDAVWIRSYRLLAWALVAVLAAITAFFFVRWLRQRPRRAPAGPPPDPIDVRTLRALDELAKEELPRQGRVREYYFLLSEILRGYLGERYGIDALECTSAELIQRLGTVPDPALPTSDLRTFLDEADLVKFARAGADPAACARALEFAHLLVRRTAPPLPSSHAPGNHLPAA